MGTDWTIIFLLTFLAHGLTRFLVHTAQDCNCEYLWLGSCTISLNNSLEHIGPYRVLATQILFSPAWISTAYGCVVLYMAIYKRQMEQLADIGF